MEDSGNYSPGFVAPGPASVPDVLSSTTDVASGLVRTPPELPSSDVVVPVSDTWCTGSPFDAPCLQENKAKDVSVIKSNFFIIISLEFKVTVDNLG